MAELASGAVSSLLGLLRNEAVLLGRVGIDVEFIKEEMESMHSFLEHLARTEPPVTGHDEQVRTWMRQVRDLAHDCRNCIDLFLQRGDPAVYRARGGRWRYLWWASWLLQKIIAQHKAAVRLRDLKVRARDVGERRFRYGVEIPGKVAVAGTSAAAASSAQAAPRPLLVAEEEDNVVDIQAAVVADISDPCPRALELWDLEDYCTDKIVDWLKPLKPEPKSKEEEVKSEQPKKERSAMPSIAIVTSDKEDARHVAYDTCMTVGAHFEQRVLVDLHMVHLYYLPLRPFDILYYILLETGKLQSQQQEGTDQDKEEQQGDDEDSGGVDDSDGEEGGEDKSEDKDEDEDEDEDEELEEDKDDEDIDDTFNSTSLEAYQEKWKVDKEKCKVHKEIMGKIKKMKIDIKVKQIKRKITELNAKQLSMEGKEVIGTSGVLLMALILLSDEQRDLDSARKQARRILEWDKKKIIKNMAKMLESYIQEGGTQICLVLAQYEGILRKTIYPTSKRKITLENKLTLGEHQNEQEDTSVVVEKLGAADKLKHEQIKSAIEETKKKMNGIKRNIVEQLLVKGLVDKIKGHLQDKRVLVILNDKKNYISRWDEIRNALSLLVDCIAGVVIITTTKNRAYPAGIKTKDRERTYTFCDPPREPITYTLVGRYYDTVLRFMRQRVNKDDGYNPNILLKILGKCDPHEFCMKMFAHALYSNPNRSSEELCMLCDDLQDSKNSWATNAKTMFKFSYNDLPREHKSCLLYLAIFPQGYIIQRSTVIGRWVTEGLITKEDWSTAVRHADRCFDNLINRWLVLPEAISAVGKVKSCVVGDEVRDYITKIAYKEHILDARLSKQWARHFSIFSGLRFRASDNIERFAKKLPKYSRQLTLLKLLDIENCRWLGNDHRYLKDICRTILLLKYLSLRGTYVTHLPIEINNLHELEVLDIRQTKVPERETRDVLLLKLRRLLAGNADPSTSSHDMDVPITDNKDNNLLPTSVRIPCKIKKMENMEVLSNVKASQHGDEIKDIRKLWQLRKLGLVIDDKEAHLRNFLRVASDLKECLRSVSITVTETATRSEGTVELQLPAKLSKLLTEPPNNLESLSISGTTQKVKLLQLLAQGSNELVKVTLSNTALKNQHDLNDLVELPNLRCVRFRHEAYTQKEFTFKKNEFQHLEYFLVEGPNMKDVIFEEEALPELEKIVLSHTEIKFLPGVDKLPKLQEIELKHNRLLLSLFEHANQITKVTLYDTLLKQNDMLILASKPNMTCLVLLDKSYDESKLIFNKDQFPKLSILIVKCLNITDVSFTIGSAPNLKKFIWSYTNIESLSGIGNLMRLKKLELYGDSVPHEVSEYIKSHKKEHILLHKKSQKEDQAKENELEDDDDDDDERFSPLRWILKKKGRR